MKQNKFYSGLITIVLILAVCLVAIKLGENPDGAKKTNQVKTETKSAVPGSLQDKSASSEDKKTETKAKVSETRAQDIILKAHPGSTIQGNERRQSSGLDYYIVYYVDGDGTAKAAYVDVSSGKILYERNADE